VRDELWKRATDSPPDGYVLQVWNAPGPQGFAYRQYGASDYRLVEFEGLTLVARTRRARKAESSSAATPDPGKSDPFEHQST
jgi:hypothetical protein